MEVRMKEIQLREWAENNGSRERGKRGIEVPTARSQRVARTLFWVVITVSAPGKSHRLTFPCVTPELGLLGYRPELICTHKEEEEKERHPGIAKSSKRQI